MDRSYGAGAGAKWHPSRAFHMLRGEAITWLYTMMLLDAMLMVESDMKNNTGLAALSEGIV